nr:uncharacterized protein LOC129258052 [Lytechinus pictus]
MLTYAPSRKPGTNMIFHLDWFPFQPDNLVEAQLVEHLLAAIDDIMTRHPEAAIFITGDFNRLDISALVADPRFKQVVRQATRGDRILDKIICNISDRYKEVIICSPIGQSDHNSVLWLPRDHVAPSNASHYRTTHPMPDSAIQSFGMWLNSVDWTDVTNKVDINEKYELFIQTLQSAIDHFFPIRRVKLHKCDKPWMTPRIKHLIKERQRAFHRNDIAVWKRLKATLKVSIEHAKKEYYASRVQRLKKNNPSAWFRQIRVITGNTKDPNPIQVPDIPSSDEAAIAAAINQSFASVASDIHQLDLAELPSYLPSKSPCPTVSSWEVYKELSKVQQSKAGSPDSISARIIREFCLELATPLADVINTSFSQSKVPSDWKRAIVIPVPKTQPPTIDKLRPISLTSHFAKIAEGFMANWILQDIRPKLDPNQFGNRKFLSTNHYLINMLHLMYENADKPKATSSVIVTDFSKAFDRVDHTIALTLLTLLTLTSY